MKTAYIERANTNAKVILEANKKLKEETTKGKNNKNISVNIIKAWQLI